jgi:hypothetical protein
MKYQKEGERGATKYNKEEEREEKKEMKKK